MELRHLRYFIAVAEEGSFSRAAQRLHIAQPPLSQQIGSLEEEMGVQLFARTARGVTLTHAGEAFLTEARLTVAQSVKAMETAQRAERGEVGRLEIGFITSATNATFSRIIRQFRAEHPHISAGMHDLCEIELIKRVRTGALDVAFMRHVPEDEDIQITELWRDALSVGLPAGHPLAARRTLRVEELAAEPFIMLNPDRYPMAHNCIHELCRDKGFFAQVVQHANDYQSLLWLVSVGTGVTIAADGLKSLQREGMVWRPVKDAQREARMLMVRRRENASPSLRLFQRTVLAETVDLREQAGR